MIVVMCGRCGNELAEPGALLFSPPTRVGQTHKLHLCVDCWKKIAHEIRDARPV